jgi:predicted anti-sigma-YlaC factor YlaD
LICSIKDCAISTPRFLELYAMRTLPESACATLEEHLLICSECRGCLQTTEQYVAAMKAAAKL